MKESIENTEFQIDREGGKTSEETWKKSIPAQVFLNYFFAINYHITQTEKLNLKELNYFRKFEAQLGDQEQAAVRKLLLQAWSTEWALRSTAKLGDEDYLRHALHWSFPQAYYAVFSVLQAFMHCFGIHTNNPDVVSREIGRLVLQGAYPSAMSFYAAGPYDRFKAYKLPQAAPRPGLQVPETAAEAQAQIEQFLRTTRRQKAQAVRRQLQSNSQTALRSANTGKILEKWSSKHWQQITWRLGYTSYFDLLGRLRISASHKETERFVEAEIDFGLFHASLVNIVNYINGLHEAYLAKAMGLQQYQNLVAALPQHLQQGFVSERMHNMIEPLLNEAPAYTINSAA